MPARLAVDEVVAFCLRASAGELREIELIARELRRLWGYDLPAG